MSGLRALKSTNMVSTGAPYILFTGMKCTQQLHLLLPASHSLEQFKRNLSHNTALITKVRRENYVRMYPVTVIQPDGSSYTIRYTQPRYVIRLPLDIKTLSPEAAKLRLEQRKPKQKIDVVREEKDNYQASKYVKLIRKK